MSIGKYCNREVIVISKNESIEDAIQLMRLYHVGDLVVVDSINEKKPVGILTDRDIVVMLLAKNVDLSTIRVSDVMSDQLATTTEDTDLLDAIEIMKTKGVRRLPITDQNNNLIGLLTADDILDLVAEQVGSLAKLVNKQQKNEALHRP